MSQDDNQPLEYGRYLVYIFKFIQNKISSVFFISDEEALYECGQRFTEKFIDTEMQRTIALDA